MNTYPVCQHLARRVVRCAPGAEKETSVPSFLPGKHPNSSAGRAACCQVELRPHDPNWYNLKQMHEYALLFILFTFFEHKKGAIKCQDFIQLICRVQHELQSPQFGDSESGA